MPLFGQETLAGRATKDCRTGYPRAPATFATGTNGIDGDERAKSSTLWSVRDAAAWKIDAATATNRGRRRGYLAAVAATRIFRDEGW